MCKVQCLKNRYMSKNNFSVWIKHEGLSVSYQYERNCIGLRMKSMSELNVKSH